MPRAINYKQGRSATVAAAGSHVDDTEVSESELLLPVRSYDCPDWSGFSLPALRHEIHSQHPHLAKFDPVRPLSGYLAGSPSLGRAREHGANRQSCIRGDDAKDGPS